MLHTAGIYGDLPGSLGQTFTGADPAEEPRLCPMWEAGAGCVQQRSCTGHHDLGLRLLNQCEYSKALCQGFGCHRLCGQQGSHHEAWWQDVLYYKQERLPGHSPGPHIYEPPGILDNERNAQSRWLDAFLQDFRVMVVSEPARAPALYAWFAAQFLRMAHVAHLPVAGPGFSTMMFHTVSHELLHGPDNNNQQGLMLRDIHCREYQSFLMGTHEGPETASGEHGARASGPGI